MAIIAAFARAESYCRRHPGEAATDLVGAVLICAFVLVGLTLPTLL